MTTGLFDRTGVRFEVAQGALGVLISYHAELVANELDNASPDQEKIAASDTARAELRALRDTLDPSDHASVEAVIAEYGPQAHAVKA